MNKRWIILDFDGVLADSVLGICEAFGKIRNKTYDPLKVKTWNFKDIIDNVTDKQVNRMFSNVLFWDALKPIKGSVDFVNKYKDRIIICSIGDTYNQINKLAWIEKTFGKVNLLPVVTDFSDPTFNKSLINMEGCIFIEDSIKNLDISNASHKILFNNYDLWDCEWNLDIDNRYVHASTFDELDKLIQQLDK